jgi:hypothetical protein
LVSDEFGPFAGRRPFWLAFRSGVIVIGGFPEGGDFGDGVWKFDNEVRIPTQSGH